MQTGASSYIFNSDSRFPANRVPTRRMTFPLPRKAP